MNKLRSLFLAFPSDVVDSRRQAKRILSSFFSCTDVTTYPLLLHISQIPAAIPAKSVLFSALRPSSEWGADVFGALIMPFPMKDLTSMRGMGYYMFQPAYQQQRGLNIFVQLGCHRMMF